MASSLLLYRNLLGNSIEVRDSPELHSLTSWAGISTSSHTFLAKGKLQVLLILGMWVGLPLNESFADRIFAPYSVYKGKASLSVEPCLPTFAKLDVSLIFCFL